MAPVIPAKAGIQFFKYLDARLRGHDSTIYKINRDKSWSLARSSTRSRT